MSQAKFHQLFPKMPAQKILLISVISVSLFLALWAVVAELGVVSKVFLPSPFVVFNKLGPLIADGHGGHGLFKHIGISLGRIMLSLLLATLLAVPLGILVAISDWFKSIVDPFVEFYRPLPPLAYLPLIIIWLGIGELSKVTLISLAIFAPIFLNTRAGVLAIPLERIQVAECLGASKKQIIYHIIFPSSLYSILTGIRIGVGFGWTTLVAAEMVAATHGLGHMVLSVSEFLVTEVVLIGIVIIGFLAIMTDWVLRVLIRKIVHWNSEEATG